MYDTNKDGSIDFKEYMISVYNMMNGSPEERLNLMFPLFDMNNDGLVSYEEIYVIGKDNTSIMKHKFNSLLCLCWLILYSSKVFVPPQKPWWKYWRKAWRWSEGKNWRNSQRYFERNGCEFRWENF